MNRPVAISPTPPLSLLRPLRNVAASLQYHYSGVGYIVKPSDCVVVASSVSSLYATLPDRNSSLADMQVPDSLTGVCSRPPLPNPSSLKGAPNQQY